MWMLPRYKLPNKRFQVWVTSFTASQLGPIDVSLTLQAFATSLGDSLEADKTLLQKTPHPGVIGKLKTCGEAS